MKNDLHVKKFIVMILSFHQTLIHFTLNICLWTLLGSNFVLPNYFFIYVSIVISFVFASIKWCRIIHVVSFKTKGTCLIVRTWKVVPPKGFYLSIVYILISCHIKEDIFFLRRNSYFIIVLNIWQTPRRRNYEWIV